MFVYVHIFNYKKLYKSTTTTTTTKMVEMNKYNFRLS